MIAPRMSQGTATENDHKAKERGDDSPKWAQVAEHYSHLTDFRAHFDYESNLIRLNRPIQIVLASGSKLFLEGLQRVLENSGDMKIVAHASSPEEVERCLTNVKPKVLLLDNRALELSVQKLSNLIAKGSPDTKVILFGDHFEGESAIHNAIYVNKDTDSSELIHIIKSVSGGALAKDAKTADDIKNQFTKTEMKIIASIAECLSNKDIAKKLSISDKTVKAHLSNIFSKLDIESRYQLIIYARRLKGRAM